MKDKIILSYLAGYFEGEGSISIVLHSSDSCKFRKGKAYVMYVSVGNTETDIIDIYKNLFGGTTWIQNRGTTHNWKNVIRWKVCSKKALIFLQEIKPFLKTKRKKELCDLAISFQKHKLLGFLKKKKGYPPEYYIFEDEIVKKISKLNRRGK